jgi:hypothetical protein
MNGLGCRTAVGARGGGGDGWQQCVTPKVLVFVFLI